MTDDQMQNVKDDIAFMRALAAEGQRTPMLGGAIMAAAGVIFAIASLAFLHDARSTALTATFHAFAAWAATPHRRTAATAGCGTGTTTRFSFTFTAATLAGVAASATGLGKLYRGSRAILWILVASLGTGGHKGDTRQSRHKKISSSQNTVLL